MKVKVNCEFNYCGAWCNCPEVKRKWFEIGGKGCVEYPYPTNECQHKKIRTQFFKTI